jgi:hypothetical protein
MARAAHGTLTPGQVAQVTISAGWAGIEIVNRSLHGTIWVRFDGQDPQPEGEDSFCVLGARSFLLRGNGITVRLLSDEALKFSVEAS